MKKLTKIILTLIVLAGIIYFISRKYFSGESSFQSIYLVPENASFIIESDNVFEAWDKIIHSNAWSKIGKVPYFSNLNKDIESLDSLLNKNKPLLKIIGHRKVMASCHEYKPKKNDFLFIVNVGKAAGFRNPEKLISSFLGDKYPLTKRNFKETVIYELLNKKSGEMYFFSFLQDKAIISTNYTLVEASIDQMGKMSLGRNLDFINVSKHISGKGLFNIYINYRYFTGTLENMLGKSTPGIHSLRRQLLFSAFTFDIKSDGSLSLEGYTSINDSVPSFFNSAIHGGKSGFESSSIIPDRISSLVKIGFQDAANYYLQSVENLNNYDTDSYQQDIQKLEKKLKIDVKENIFGWIDDEIVLLRTQPSNLGKNNEFALIIKGKNETDPVKNLDFVAHQIEKNLPVKIKQVNYEEYSIHYISFPGLLKLLFGKMLSKIEKPYYTFIGEYVIFSNHPQTLKNIIDDFKKDKVLANSENYKSFVNQFSNKNSAFSYIDIPVFFNSLKDFVSPSTWAKINRQKKVITCFPQAGFEFGENDNLLQLLINVKYKDVPEDFVPQQFDNEFLTLFANETNNADTIIKTETWYEPEIIIDNLDSRELSGYFDDGKLKFNVGLKSGLKHGNYKEYYNNGEIHVKGRFKNDRKDGEWKLYDENGTLIESKEFAEGIMINE
jgi:hypothetical protein